jgi:hypothetical protein
MTVLYITVGQTQYETQFIYIVVSMITMRTPIAFQTLLLGLLLTTIIHGTWINYNKKVSGSEI